jgi:hypothetical protein
MSANPADAQPSGQPATRSSSGSSNVFTRKIGPLPMWGWMAIGLVVAVAYYFYEKNKSSSQTPTPSAEAADQIPQFVNQTYVQTNPPAAPNPGPPGHTTNPGPSDTKTVPDVTGKSVNAARVAANKAGFDIHSSITSGEHQIVTSQTPAAGTKVTKGSSYWPSTQETPLLDIGNPGNKSKAQPARKKT